MRSHFGSMFGVLSTLRTELHTALSDVAILVLCLGFAHRTAALADVAILVLFYFTTHWRPRVILVKRVAG